MRFLKGMMNICLGILCVVGAGLALFLFAVIIDVIRSKPNDFKKLVDYTIHNYIQSEREWKVTAYCPNECCCQEFADGITASGYKIRAGNKLCAADFDFCTVLDIPGYGIAPVLDRGGTIKEGCIDIYFDTHQEALEWGVKYLKIGIVEWLVLKICF